MQPFTCETVRQPLAPTVIRKLDQSRPYFNFGRYLNVNFSCNLTCIELGDQGESSANWESAVKRDKPHRNMMKTRSFIQIILFPILAVVVFIRSTFRFFLPNKWLKVKELTDDDLVLVTGGASSLGKEIALQFVYNGCKQLILWDESPESLAEVKGFLEKYGVDVTTFIVDIRYPNEVYSLAEKVSREIGTVTYLVNCTNHVTGKLLTELSDDSIRKSMDVNVLSHFWTVKAFLPGMICKKHGHIVTVSSIMGFLGSPFLSDYCASKFASVGFHASLRFELLSRQFYGIKTTCVAPFAIDTNGSALDIGYVPILKARDVAEATLDAVLANREVLILPLAFRWLLAFSSFLPYELLDFACFLLTNTSSVSYFFVKR